METETILGRVERVFWTNEARTIGKLRRTTGGAISFVLRGAARAGDGVELSGHWVDDPKYGRQFEVDAWCLDARALGADGLAAYLAKFEGFAGIGPARAGKIAREFGDRFDAALADPAEREAMARIAGCSVEVVERLAIEWGREATLNRTAARLAEFGLSATRARRLAAKFGGGVVETIRTNPWWLLGRLRGLGFAFVDGIAGRLGCPLDHPERVMHGVVTAIEKEEADGHVWTPAATAVAAAVKLLKLDALHPDEIVARGIARAVAEDAIEVVEIDGRPAGYAIAETAAAERYVAAQIAARAGRGGFSPGTTAEIAQQFEERLNERQAEAVAAACDAGLSVMTGAAGTGKTFCITTICRIAEERGLRVALAAPTGKAALRMQESTGRPAKTIHRTLAPEIDYDDLGEPVFDFRLRGKPISIKDGDRTTELSGFIEADLVIVDEVSMVDVHLARSLLRALRPATALVLVGDPNQLPPVGPGSILRDLVQQRPCPVTALSQVVRQAGTLKECINAVLRGTVPDTTPTEPLDGGLVRPWVVSARHESPVDAAAFAVKAFVELLPKQAIDDPRTGERRPIRPFEDVQILTPQHKGPAGTVALNRAVQRAVQRARGVEVAPPADGEVERAARPLAGDRVIWTRNDYRIVEGGLMNGTLGQVIERASDGTYLVTFDGVEDPVAVTAKDASEKMQLAYAITVHKSQGSEFPIALSVVHKSHRFMHHRSLIYTAVSRARVASIIVGDPWGTRNCAKVVRVDDRRSLAASAGGFARVAAAADPDAAPA